MASERSRSALSNHGLQVLVIARKVGSESTTTYYVPTLKMLRHESNDRTVIIHFEKGMAYVMFHDGREQVREVDLESFREVDALARKYTRDITGVSIGNGRTFGRKWAILQIDSKASKFGDDSCFEAVLVNQFRERKAMCVIKDPRVLQLAFLKTYLKNVPSHLRGLFEDPAELFLYEHGIVPLQTKRRGKNIQLEDIREERMPRAWFEVPKSKKREHYGAHYKNAYLESLKLTE